MLSSNTSLLMVENLRKKEDKAKANSFFLPTTPATTASWKIESAIQKKVILTLKRILLPFFYTEDSQSAFIISNYIKLYLLLHFDIEGTLERMIICSPNF